LNCKGIPAFLLFFFLTCCNALYAKGNREEYLDQAKQLVEEQKYDEARAILADIIRNDPDMFEAAMELIDEINKREKQFNEALEELIVILYDKGDVEGALEKIEELNEFNPNPNESIVEMLETAYEGAAWQANLNRFIRIMDTAMVFLNQKEFDKAVETYLTGFDLHKDEFDEAEYGEILKDLVETSLSDLFSITDTFIQMQEEIRDVSSSLNSSFTNDSEEEIKGQLTNFLNIMLEVESIRQKTQNVASIISEQNRIIQQSREDNSADNFLTYCKLLILGRSTEEEPEGIMNAVGLLLQDVFYTSENYTFQEAYTHYTQMLSAYLQSDYKTALEENNKASFYFDLLMQLSYQLASGESLMEGYSISQVGNILYNYDYKEFNRFQISQKEIESFYKLIIDLSDSQYIADTKEPPDLNKLVEIQQLVNRLTGSIKENANEWDRFKYLVGAGLPWSQDQEGIIVPEQTPAMSGYFVKSINDNLQPAASLAVASILREYNRILGLLLNDTADRFEQSRDKLQNGEVVTYVEEDQEKQRTVYYPDRRLEELNQMKDVLSRLSVIFSEIKTAWPLEQQYLLKTGEIDELVKEAQSLEESLASLEGEIDEQWISANEDVITAGRLKMEGEKRYSDARNAYGRGEYSDAREYLDEAIVFIEQSLAKQEDEALRQLRDVELMAFLDEVINAENKLVIDEVRRLINEGIASYREGRYEEAETVLIQAQTRWSDTKTYENEEINNWLVLVRNALTSQQGWIIDETNPLYPEITQRLNLATEDYNRGLKLYEQENYEEGEKAFEDALEKLDNISISNPLLKEANILRLRINKLYDPDNFYENLNKDKQDALDFIRYGREEELGESYSKLSDYDVIVPEDMEIDNIIYQLKLALKIIEPPPSPEDIQTSRQRYQDALEIYNNRIRDLYSRAIELCNEAIKIWPDNQDAISLKDKIEIDLGGDIGILTYDDKQKLLEAMKLFGEKNYYGANELVEELWSNPGNRGDPQLIDLRDKIQKRL
jgi:hypothetical protein